MSVIETAQRNKEGQKKPTRYYSNKQEKKVADTYKGFQTKNSGATKFGGKGDVLIPGLMSIECKTKTTLSDSISIKSGSASLWRPATTFCSLCMNSS